MHKITLLTVGGLRESWAKEGATMYVERLRSALQLAIVELPASRRTDAAAQARDESERLVESARKQRGQIWALDERGAEMTSLQFARELGELKDRGEPAVFLLGGAYGLTDEARSIAHRQLRLSRMTLPHELCRVVFLEQLYRAVQIHKGSGYHH